MKGWGTRRSSYGSPTPLPDEARGTRSCVSVSRWLGVKRLEEPAAQAEAAAGPSAQEQTLARRFLLVVGAGYLLAQLVLFSYHRAPGWDESVYLSQVMPGAQAFFFAPSRARGIMLLIAPAARLGGTVGAVRLSLV